MWESERRRGGQRDKKRESLEYTEEECDITPLKTSNAIFYVAISVA